MPVTPFTDPRRLAPLYATPDRLARRTGALHAAKISGQNATTTITELAARRAPARPVVCDIGCGRGTTTIALAAHLTPRQLIAIDRSPALLHTVRARATHAGHAVASVCADFHHLPLPDGVIDVGVAAFCLYHSPHPERVVAEIARCLVPGGRTVLVTKSVDSYRELDHLVARARLDPDAPDRPSLYSTFHTGNAPDIAATALHEVQVTLQHHVFRFAGLDHLAAYLSTSPKYQLPDHLTGDTAALATALRRQLPNEPITTTSTVTYVTAATP